MPVRRGRVSFSLSEQAMAFPGIPPRSLLFPCGVCAHPGEEATVRRARAYAQAGELWHWSGCRPYPRRRLTVPNTRSTRLKPLGAVN
jgi:hypothetical protein